MMKIDAVQVKKTIPVSLEEILFKNVPADIACSPIPDVKDFKSLKFEIIPYKSGSFLNRRPNLPTIVKQSIIKIIQQCVVLQVSQRKDVEIVPHPLCVLLDRKMAIAEMEVFGIKDQKLTDDQVKFLDNITSKMFNR